jgi:hypothetical protein
MVLIPRRPEICQRATLEIGDPLLGIGDRAVGRRAHLRTSSGPIFRADHTLIDTGYPQVVDRDDQRSSSALQARSWASLRGRALHVGHSGFNAQLGAPRGVLPSPQNGQVVLISGESGIDKSRTTVALEERLQANPIDGTVLEFGRTFPDRTPIELTLRWREPDSNHRFRGRRPASS